MRFIVVVQTDSEEWKPIVEYDDPAMPEGKWRCAREYDSWIDATEVLIWDTVTNTLN